MSSTFVITYEYFMFVWGVLRFFSLLFCLQTSLYLWRLEEAHGEDRL